MNNTVKVILIIVGLAVIGLGAGIGVRFFMKGKPGAESPKVAKSSDFAWGVTVLTFPFPTYQEAFTAKQIAESKKLGINYIRVDYAPNNPKASEVAVEAAKKQGLSVVLVIPFGPKDIFTNKNLATDTETYIGEAVKRFKGKVAVYQLATEVASVALGNNAAAHGIETKDYPTDKLTAVTTWVKTASETVKKQDPKALRLVNDQWVHTGFFDHFFDSGGDFDLLGWNWFSDMGNSMDSVTIDKAKGQNVELLAKISAYNKPIWLTEVNRRLGSQGNKDKEQADFITTMGAYVKTRPAIKGFFVFNLLEDQTAPVKEKGYSIITASDSEKDQKITGQKPAFAAYKNIIQN